MADNIHCRNVNSEIELQEREGLLPTIQEDIIIQERESPLAAVLRQKRTPINRRMTRSGALKSRTLSHKEPSDQDLLSDLTEDLNQDFFEEILKQQLRVTLDQKDFQKLVAQKSNASRVSLLAAEVDVGVQLAIDKHKSNASLALLTIVSKPCSENYELLLVTKFLQRGANPRHTDEKGRSALHYAAAKGHAGVTEKLLESGASCIQTDTDGNTPLGVAICSKNDNLSSLMMKYISDKQIKNMFMKRSSRPVYTFSLHNLIENNMKLTVLSVLDSMIEPDTKSFYNNYIIHYSVLEMDKGGKTPDKYDFNKKDKSCFQLLTANGDKDYISHPVVRMLIRKKWIKFARFKFMLSAVVYLLILVLLTVAAVLAMESEDPGLYRTPEDIIRAVCEFAVITNAIYTLVQEIQELRRLRCDYLKDPYNMLDVGIVILTLAVIPARFIHNSVHWFIFAMVYGLFVLRSVKYSPIIRSMRMYTRIMFTMVTSIFIKFIAMFTIVAVAFTGTFALTLRIEGKLSERKDVSVKSFWHVLFTSIRVLYQSESVLEYINEEGPVFGWLCTVIYAIYLFIILVMLLNILIAQLSDIYNMLRADADVEVDIDRAWIISNVQFKNRLSFLYRKCSSVDLYEDHEVMDAEALSDYQVLPAQHKQEQMKHIIKISEQVEDLDLVVKRTSEKQDQLERSINDIREILLEIQTRLQARMSSDTCRNK